MKKSKIAVAAVALAIAVVSSAKAEPKHSLTLKNSEAMSALEGQAVEAGVNLDKAAKVPKVKTRKPADDYYIGGARAAGGLFSIKGGVGAGENYLSLGDAYNTLQERQEHPQCLYEAGHTDGDGNKTASELISDTKQLFYFDEVDSVSTLDKRQNIGAKIGGKWIAASFEAALDLADVQHQEHSGTDLIGVVDIGLGQENLKYPNLIGRNLTLLKEHRDTFIRRCGDMFVHGLVKGGSLHAYIHISANNASDKKNLDSHFTGDGWGISSNAKFSSEILEAQKSHHVTITYVISGGKPVTIDNDPDAIRSFVNTANNFIQGITATNAKNIAYDLFPYTAAQNWDGDPDSMEMKQEQENLQRMKDGVRGIKEQQKKLMGFYEHAREYRDFDKAKLAVATTTLAGYLGKLNDQIDECRAKFVCPKQTLDTVNFPEPTVKPVRYVLGNCPANTENLGLPGSCGCYRTNTGGQEVQPGERRTITQVCNNGNDRCKDEMCQRKSQGWCSNPYDWTTCNGGGIGLMEDPAHCSTNGIKVSCVADAVKVEE